MALGRGQVGGGCLGAWGYPHIHAYACTHMYTCIEITNGHPHGGIHVYHFYNMFTTCMGVCMHACMHMHACACMHGTLSHTPIPMPTPIHPPATPQGETPGVSQDSITLELIKIIRFHLKI